MWSSFYHKRVGRRIRKNNTLGESYQKYLIFKVPIENKVMKIDKNGEEITKDMSTDSARFITSSLSNLVNNLSEEIHKIKCK